MQSDTDAVIVDAFAVTGGRAALPRLLLDHALRRVDKPVHVQADAPTIVLPSVVVVRTFFLALVPLFLLEGVTFVVLVTLVALVEATRADTVPIESACCLALVGNALLVGS